MKNQRSLMLKVTIWLAIFLPASNAYAYLDPGMGSIILQGIIGALAVTGMVVKTYWYKILSFFGKAPPSSILDEEDEQ